MYPNYVIHRIGTNVIVRNIKFKESFMFDKEYKISFVPS